MGGSRSKENLHPYLDPEQKLEPGSSTKSSIVYGRVYNLWSQRNGEVKPREVVNLFNDPKRERELWPDITLYDVWLNASYKASELGGAEPKALRGDEQFRFIAKRDQVASLLEEAMELTGHRPPDDPKFEFPDQSK